MGGSRIVFFNKWNSYKNKFDTCSGDVFNIENKNTCLCYTHM